MTQNPINTDQLAIAGRNTFYITSDGGNNWEDKSSCVNFNAWFGVDYSKSGALWVNARRKTNSSSVDKYSDILKSNNNGLTWENIPSLIYTQTENYYPGPDVHIKVLNDSLFFAGGATLAKFTFNSSTNTYISVVDATEYWGSNTHADIRDICFPIDSNYNLGFIVTDGGINRTKTGGNNQSEWKRIYGNLGLNECYSVAISEQESEIMIIGTHDNGTYRRDSSGIWKNIYLGDGGTCFISSDFSNDSIAFCTSGPGSPCTLHRSDDGGEHFNAGSTSFHKHDSPLLQHPDSSNIYYKGLTYGDAQPVIMKSIDSGGNFDTLIKFNNAWGNVSAMGQSKSNPDYFYFATYDSYNSVDGFTPYFGALAPQTTCYKFGEIYLDNKYAKITEIDVSPTDESLIWLSVGNFLEGKKVFQSTDAGLTWTNISYNLDNIPVNTVKYDQNTNTLFVGTDVGLFYLNEATNGTDTVWERYGDFPLVICSDIKINNATSQIIAATYGRGVWRADIGCNTTPGEVSVEVSTTFSEDKQFRNVVYIEDGGTLTLSNAEFKFIPDAQIIVQPGGKLIIDGAKLTSSCGEPWKGIIVLGDSTLSQQDDSYQGVVEVKNGAIIENALSAIFVGNPDNPGNNQSGGIVRIYSAIFRDNKACVEMTKYHNFAFNNPIYRISNKSYIINSTFETTDYLAKYDLNPYSYIALWEVDGIHISGNTFTNLNPEAYTSTTKGKGIVSTSGGFYSYDNTFENLSYGIYATDPDLVSDISVTNTDFVDNNTGILIDAVDYITVHHNNFEIPDISWVYGIYAIDNTTTFIVEENNFTGQSNALSWGVYSTNNSATFNLYLNNFNDLFNGIYGSSSSSMKFECDSFQDNSTDVYISSNGASSNQGWRFEAAGNKFLGSCSSTSDIYSLMTIYYKYLPAATDPPSCVTSNVLLSTSNYANACASNFESSGGDEQKGIDELTALALEITQKEALLLELTDGGDTPETIKDVATAEPEEALILRNNLLSKSPNLSDTVMHQSITVEDVLPSLMLTQILSSNPQAAKSDKVQNALDNRQNQLPQYMRDEIDKGKDTLSPKEELESEIEWLKSRKYRLFSQKLSDLELDTNQQDVIEMMLVEDNSLQSKYKLVSFYLTNNNIAEASNVFDDIPQQFVLTPKEQVEYETMSLVFEIQLALKKSGKSYFDMDSLQKATIYELTEDTLHRAGSVARSIISLVDGVEYNYRGYIPIYEEEVFKTEQQPNPIFKFNLFPNPANDYFIVDYDFATFDFKNASFNLQNTGNKIIYSEKLENKAYQFLVETESIRPGFYIGKLYENGKEVSSQGIVIKQDQLSVQEKADAEKLLADFEKETNKTMIVYPNPAGDYVIVNFFSTPQGTKQLLQITDNTGRVIISENISENTSDIKLNTSILPTGVYAVNFIVDGVVVASKTLIIE
ncbi:MAG: T9SS type A sorting domain-containing protein [Bacteroidales bacterium]|nr:T9SS type A sorting domain-containing protein [Bacteroidales bacterium]